MMRAIQRRWEDNEDEFDEFGRGWKRWKGEAKKRKEGAK
jgi:hypothetical protein